MRKVVMTSLAILAVVFLASPVLAQDQPENQPAPVNWLAIAGGFGMALAAAGCGYGQSRVASSACEGMARNPGASDAIRAAMFLGLVFIETLALFTLVIIFTLIFI